MAAQASQWERRQRGARPGFPAPLNGYPGVILLAHREVVVRNMATMLMELEGNLVLSASHGWEALGVSRAFKGSIEIAITDADLPGLECADLCGQLLTERPGIKVLVLSGIGGESRDCGAHASPPVLFDAGTLRATVRRTLEAPALSFPYVYMTFPGNPPVDGVHATSLAFPVPVPSRA